MGRIRKALSIIRDHILLALVMIFILFPFAWLVVSSFKSAEQIFEPVPSWIIKDFTFEHYIWMLSADGGNLMNYINNSLVATILTVIITMFIALTSGYAIGRFDFPGKPLFLGLLFATQMFQGPLIMIPWYRMGAFWGILDTKTVLVLIYGTMTIPITVVMMSGFFKTVPIELEEAAYIDGCSKLQTLVKIDLPLVKPGIVAVAIMAFIIAWNDYQYALILTSSPRAKTVQVVITDYMQAIGNIDWGGLLAGGVVVTVPVIIIFGFAQKYLVEGLTQGAIKG
jgi:multiple sugar transport system permease protein